MSADPLKALVSDVVSASFAEERKALLQLLPSLIGDAVLVALAKSQADVLQPLHKIRGGTAPAARMFLRSHPDLAGLGTPIGKRLLFKRSDFDAWCTAKKMARQRRNAGGDE